MPDASDRLRVLVADTDMLVRRLLSETLRRHGHVVVAEALGAHDALDLVLYYRPRCALISRMPPPDAGVELIRRIKDALADTIDVVALTPVHDDAFALEVLRAGASGYLTKDIGPDGIVRAVEVVRAGEPAISRQAVAALVERLRALPDMDIGIRPVRSPLTPREWEVLDLLCQGYNTEAIARELVLSVETVRSHVKRILRKTGASSRAEAVACAERLRRRPSP